MRHGLEAIGGPHDGLVGTFLSCLILEVTLEVAFDTNHRMDDKCYLALTLLIGCQLLAANEQGKNPPHPSEGDGRMPKCMHPAQHCEPTLLASGNARRHACRSCGRA
jgi:hypothetical protein